MFSLKVLFVPQVCELINFGTVNFVFPGGYAGSSNHRTTCRRIKTEIIPDINQGFGSTVRAAFRKHTHGRIACPVKGQYSDSIV